MCWSGVTCRSEHCSRELALYKSNKSCWSSTKQTSFHHNVTFSCHDKDYLFDDKQQSLTHSPSIISLRGKVCAHISLTSPLFIEVPVPSQENERSYIYLLGVSLPSLYQARRVSSHVFMC
jgi:hypothetical protein